MSLKGSNGGTNQTISQKDPTRELGACVRAPAAHDMLRSQWGNLQFIVCKLKDVIGKINICS